MHAVIQFCVIVQNVITLCALPIKFSSTKSIVCAASAALFARTIAAHQPVMHVHLGVNKLRRAVVAQSAANIAGPLPIYMQVVVQQHEETGIDLHLEKYIHSSICNTFMLKQC